MCGTSAKSLKSSITPLLSGDIKTDKNHFLTKPLSTEDLRNTVRNFYVNVADKGAVSLSQIGEIENATIEAGQLWHKLIRKFPKEGIRIEAVNFVPVTDDNVELMRVKITNISSDKIKINPTASIPIFARTLANKHDHENVTSLLNRIEQLSIGVVVEPTMIFNEEGHRAADSIYYVFGATESGELPKGTFPTVNSFYGDSGTADSPEAIVKNSIPMSLSSEELHGREAMGAVCFNPVQLLANESREYFIIIGIARNKEEAIQVFEKYNSLEKHDRELEVCKDFWLNKSKAISFETGNKEFNSWMRWVCLQPILRRIFGCSFLPDHDYGKGGRGWRDIWQDLLSLILIEPENIRTTLINNFAGIRIDGTNATIIGAEPGEFIADRNNIVRVWMDHGVWPFLTTLLYIDQTGDFDILLEEQTYFRDRQLSRTLKKDESWNPRYINRLTDENKQIYKATILEHLILQNIVQFFNVGEHNITRLEGADWNDGLDMAYERGESIAFMSFYGGNLLRIADLLENLAKAKKIDSISLTEEMAVLFDSLNEGIDYDNIEEKKKLLFEKYFNSVEPYVSGRKKEIKISALVSDLRKKGTWVFEHIRKNEKIKLKIDGREYVWFNGYYDNKGSRVEGKVYESIRMTLTGQVFPIMSMLANEEEIKQVVDSVDKLLKDKNLSGIRLNTDFKLTHYLNLGRAFGFAYGTKENGSFFSHMNVMYAYGLYSRGFAHEGYKILKSIYEMCMDTDRSKIYPGIPEYFDSLGRGMYHYLTGSASWFVLTKLTQSFGMRGEKGDLIINPKLVKEEFGDKGIASITTKFAGKKITVEFVNKEKLDYGDYNIAEVKLNGSKIDFERIDPNCIRISRSIILKEETSCKFTVILS